MPWITRDQRRLYCFEAGEGRPVVLLHGMALAGIAWVPQVPALIEAGFRVLVPDMVGHGASEAPDGRVGVPDLAADLAAILDAMDVADADLVGVSMGGTTALALAAAEPERFRRLVVVNSGPSTDLPDFERMLSGWAATLRGDDGPLALLSELWPFSVNPDFADSDEGKRTWQHWSAVNAAVDGAGMAFVMEGVAGFDGAHLLARIKAPTLFVGGSEDPSAKLMVELADKVEDGRYVEIAGAKHIANVDRSDSFTRQLLQFLA